MKKIGLAFIAFLMLANLSFAETSQYRVNDDAISSMFVDAIEVSITDAISLQNSGITANFDEFFVSSDKNPAVAFILCWFVGYLGVHRYYMGTSTTTMILYIVTCGGFGIVVTIDWVMILLALIDNGDISSYIDNPKFFMWVD